MIAISVPMFFTGMFTHAGGFIRNVIILVGPYTVYLVLRGGMSFLNSIGVKVPVYFQKVLPTPNKQKK
jgi:hypothetical protein